MSDKIMAFGRELLVTPDTLGVHTSESEDKLLDIPLVADKIGKYDEDDIDEISENLANLQMKKLWENPSPTSEFQSQTITLSSSDYDYIKIFYIECCSRTRMKSEDALKGYSFKLDKIDCDYTSSSYWIYARDSDYISDTSISFANCYQRGSATSLGNAHCIPVAIYGGKFA